MRPKEELLKSSFFFILGQNESKTSISSPSSMSTRFVHITSVSVVTVGIHDDMIKDLIDCNQF